MLDVEVELLSNIATSGLNPSGNYRSYRRRSNYLKIQQFSNRAVEPLANIATSGLNPGGETII